MVTSPEARICRKGRPSWCQRCNLWMVTVGAVKGSHKLSSDCCRQSTQSQQFPRRHQRNSLSHMTKCFSPGRYRTTHSSIVQVISRGNAEALEFQVCGGRL